MLLEPVALIHTGNDTIDAQHRELMNFLNMLMLGVEAQEHEKIQEGLRGLTRYVVEHFTDEEALHAQSGCSGLEEHKLAHHQIINDLELFVQAYHRHPDAPIQMMQQLYGVVRNFMLQLEHYDVPLAAYIRSHKEIVSSKTSY